MTFLMHCGAQPATREQIAHVPTPVRTETWVPTPHIEVLSQVERALAGLNYQIVNEQYALFREGRRFFGLLEIENPEQGRNTTVGLRNSHDRAFAINLLFGSIHLVCDNLSFSGEVSVVRKHTVYAERDLPQLIDSAVARIGAFQVTEQQRFEAYKKTELGTLQADHLIIEMLRTRIISASNIPTVLKEWEAPRHPEFIDAGRSAFRLYNAATEALKSSVTQLPRRTLALTAIMDSVADFRAAA